MNTENQEPGQMQPTANNIEQNKESLEISEEIKNQLNGAGGWAKFLAILGFVFMGMMVIAGFIMSIVLAVIPNKAFGSLPFPSFLFGIFYLIMAAIYFLPILYLYRFSSGIKKALLLKNQNQFAKAFSNLKAHYRFIGILMIVLLALYPILIAIMIFAQVFHGFHHFPGMHA